jgi:hypothetical protein
LFYSKEAERTEGTERSRKERGGLHRLATEDFVPDIKGGPGFSGEAPTPEGSVVAANLEEQRRRRWRGMEDCSIALLPEMPTTEEDKHRGSFRSDRRRNREEVEVLDVRIAR